VILFVGNGATAAIDKLITAMGLYADDVSSAPTIEDFNVKYRADRVRRIGRQKSKYTLGKDKKEGKEGDEKDNKEKVPLLSFNTF